MEKKDILFICQFYSPEYVTSAELASDTCKALAEAGFSVDVLCGYPREYVGDDQKKVPKIETADGVNIRRLKYLSVSRKSVAGRLINYFSFYWAVLCRLFSMRRYKVIAAYSNPPMVTNILNIAARLFKVKTVFIAHDVYPEIAIKTGKAGKNSLMTKAMGHINRRLSRVLDGVVCISNEMADFFAEERGMPREKIAVIPNWHRDLYEGTDAAIGDGPFTCGYFGNMGICQDMETLVSAIEQEAHGNPKTNYIFAGHGSKEKYVADKLSGMANVRMPGFLRGEEYKKAMSSCDAFAVSLEAGLGGLCAPSKVYSYYMMGRPVIAVTDEKDILDDLKKYNCGIAVKNGDANGFLEAVKKLAEDPTVCAEMGKNARRCFLENYTREICCGKLTEFFKLIINREQ